MATSLTLSGLQYEVGPTVLMTLGRRAVSIWRLVVLVVAPIVIVGLPVAAWRASTPSTLIQTRIVADGSGAAARAALAQAALLIGATPGRTAALDEHGTALIISVANADAGTAWRDAHSAAEAVMALPPVATEQRRAVWDPALANAAERVLLNAERDRLIALAQANDSRAASVSTSLSTLARDLAAGARVMASPRAGREIVDKGNAALADLQLQRIQLLSRYQDDFPVVAVLDSQIRTLKAFLTDEARRIDLLAKSGSDLADPILVAERERLRAELYQLNERRVDVAAALTANSRALDPVKLIPQLDAAAPATVAPAILMEAATSVAHGPDIRWLSVPAAAVVASLLTLAAWLKPPRRRRYPDQVTTQQLEAAMTLLAQGGTLIPPQTASRLAPLAAGNRA